MRVAIAYTVFDGLELLEKSIDNIMPCIDNVIICFQQVSNNGISDENVQKFIEEKFRGKAKIHIVEFTPDLKKDTKSNERAKHQMMIDVALMIGCSHIILSACDHFYTRKQAMYALNFAALQSVDVTFTRMNTYYKRPNWQLTPLEDYYMPFVMRINEETRIISETKYPVLVDPAVRINTCKSHCVFSTDEIVLHHYSMVRDNMEGKLRNSASRFREDVIQQHLKQFNEFNGDPTEPIRYFSGRTVVETENHFHL